MELPEFKVLEEKIAKMCQVVSDLKKENEQLSEKVKSMSKEHGDFKKLKDEVKSRIGTMIGKLEGFPENLRLKLMHILISHHGREEYGSPKKPQFPEAVAVYYADDADAKVDLFLRLKREANTDDSWIWSKKIKGHVYLD